MAKASALRSRLLLVLGALLVLGLGACGATTHAPAPTTTTTTTPTTATTAPTATAPATTTGAPPSSASTAPPTTSDVGLTLSGAGNTFTAPASPTTKAYNPNCQSLIDPGFTGSCLIVTGSSGTAAGVVERQDTYQSGQPITSGQERDLVYVEVNGDWSLRLRRIPAASGQAITSLYGSDIMRDGDAKLIFVQPAPNSQFGNELDVVEETGVVSLYRQLHGGFATVAPSGGLTTYVPSASGYDSAVIDYTGGAWKIVSVAPVSQTQAQAEGDQPFSDPMAIQPTY